MNIYILESNLSYKEEIETIVFDWFHLAKQTYNLIISTSHVEELMEISIDNNYQNIYFLDISILENVHYGLKIAQAIREKDEHGQLLLLSSQPKDALLTFKYFISAQDFIVKGKDMASSIHSALSYISSQSSKWVEKDPEFLKCEINEEKILQVEDILYFENDPSARKKVFMVTTNGKSKISQKISELEKTNPMFFQSHQSYVLNLKNIRRLDTQTKKAYFFNGESCQISRRNWRKLKQKLGL